MYKCVFFDLFGTLADDDKGYDKFLVGLIDNKEKRKKFIDLWCIKRREWYKYKYSPFEDILERSFNEALKQMEIYINKANCDFLEIFQNMPQFKEIENVLLKLKNRHKIGILTNSNNDFSKNKQIGSCEHWFCKYHRSGFRRSCANRSSLRCGRIKQQFLFFSIRS